MQNNGYFDRFCCHNGKLRGDVIIPSVEMHKKLSRNIYRDSLLLVFTENLKIQHFLYCFFDIA